MVLPLLLLVVFGITEFGRAYYQYNTLSKAIRNGARYMSSHTYSSANLTNARNMVVYGQTSGQRDLARIDCRDDRCHTEWGNRTL